MNIELLLDVSLSPTIKSRSAAPGLYSSIRWPKPPVSRPYVYINMASTVDGKVVVGDPGGTAMGVGGPTDQLLFRRLQEQCDGALVGGSTLRAGNVIYPARIPRFTVTRSGNLPIDNRFFTDAPEIAYVFAPDSLSGDAAARISATAQLVRFPGSSVNLADALSWIRTKTGISALLCEGGPEINDQLVRGGLADELFLTIAPKLKGGAAISAIVSGIGFPSGIALPLSLVSVYRDGDELYLRYRISSAAASVT